MRSISGLQIRASVGHRRGFSLSIHANHGTNFSGSAAGSAAFKLRNGYWLRCSV